MNGNKRNNVLKRDDHMKPYKTDEYNIIVRQSVRKMIDYCNSHISCTRKHLSNKEFALDVSHICNIPYSIAKKVTWIVRADGERDQNALKIWGFNKHTA